MACLVFIGMIGFVMTPHSIISRIGSMSTITAVLTGALLSLPSVCHGAATAAQLAQAMDIPTNSIVSASLSQLAGADAVNAVPAWGVFAPQKGTNMAVLSTGRAFTPGSPGYIAPAPGFNFGTSHTNPAAGQVTCGGADGSTVYDYSEFTVTLAAPTNATAFSIRFNFFSVGYPEWICSAVNDRFMILLTSTGFNGNIAVDGAGNAMSINTAVFALTTPSELAGTGMETSGAATGWITRTNLVEGGESITLKFIVFDALDGIDDSLALIDGFTWHISAPQPVLEIEKAVALSWESVFGVDYQVQWASQLDTNTWYNLGPPTPGNGATNYVFDLVDHLQNRFYRVQLVE